MSSSAISAAHRRFHQRRGVAAVEFAVTAPILFLVVLGLIDVGRGVMVQQLLVNAARDGARSAVLDGATVTSVQTQVGDYLAASTVPGATVTVDPNPLTLAGIGDPVTVTVQIPFDSVSWLPPSIYLQGVTLQASVVMRSETVTAAP